MGAVSAHSARRACRIRPIGAAELCTRAIMRIRKCRRSTASGPDSPSGGAIVGDRRKAWVGQDLRQLPAAEAW